MKKKYKLLKELPQCPVNTILHVQNEEYVWVHAAGTGFQIPIKVLKDYPDWFEEVNELPKSWQDLRNISGWVINNGRPVYVENTGCHNVCKAHMYATEAQAKSALAFAQLSQLAKAMNGNWKPEWTTHAGKWVIVAISNILHIKMYEIAMQNIAFKTRELAEYSLIEHKELWEDYWMISK